MNKMRDIIVEIVKKILYTDAYFLYYTQSMLIFSSLFSSYTFFSDIKCYVISITKKFIDFEHRYIVFFKTIWNNIFMYIN